MATAVGAKLGRLMQARPSPVGSRSDMNSYSTGGGVSVGGSATGAQRSIVMIDAEFELLPPAK